MSRRGFVRRLPSASVLFLLVAGTLGPALLLTSSPFLWGDENTHFRQALGLAEGRLGPTCSAGQQVSSVPVEVTRFIFFTANRHRRQPRVTWDDMLAMRRITLRPDERVAARINGAPYSPLTYASQAMAIWLVSWGTQSVLWLFTAARVGNFLGWLGLTWLAVRLVPGLGWSFAVLGLAPLGVFLATVCSADATAIGLAFLWTAIVLRAAADPAPMMARCEVGMLVVAAVALALSKFIYVLLIPLAFLIPARRVGRPWQLVGLVALLLAASGGAVAGWLWFAGRECAGSAAITSPVSVAAQWHSLWEEPSYFLRLLRQAARAQWDVLWLRLADTKWGDDAPTAGPARWLMTAVLLAVVCDDGCPAPVGIARRALAVGLAAASFVAVVAIAFLYWTWAGAPMVDGVQTRYVLPLLPAVVVALRPPPLPLPKGVREVGGMAALLLGAGVLVHTVLRGLALFGPG